MAFGFERCPPPTGAGWGADLSTRGGCLPRNWELHWALAPWCTRAGGVGSLKGHSFLLPPAGMRVVELSPPLPTGLSLQPMTPQALAPLFLAPEDAQSQARLHLQTPRNSWLLQSPHEPPPELLRFPRTRAKPGGPPPRRGTPGRRPAGPQAWVAGRSSRPIGRGLNTLLRPRLLPGGAGRARAASAEVGRGEQQGRCPWAGILAFAAEQRTLKGTGAGLGQARLGGARGREPGRATLPRVSSIPA